MFGSAMDLPDAPRTVRVPVERALSFNAFTLGAGSRHPWYLAAQCMAQGENETARRMLEKYYELVRPASLAEWHDLPPEACPGLSGLPRHAWSIMPWKSGDPADVIRRVEAAQIEENRLHRLDAGMAAGAKAFGPVSEAKVAVELKRIAELTESISLHGLRHEMQGSELGARLLVADGRWRWLPTAGMHRIPVAAALGVRQFTLRVISVARREEAALWPQVGSELFTEKAALQLFDRLLEGRPPHCASAWLDWVDQQDEHED